MASHSLLLIVMWHWPSMKTQTRLGIYPVPTNLLSSYIVQSTWMKVFRINPEFRILLNSADNNSFSDLVSVYLTVFDHLVWNF